MINLTALTFFDYAVAFVLITSALCSILRGMTREFLGLIGWIVSVLAANYAKPLLQVPITELTGADQMSAALAWTVPFAVTVIIWFLIASLISPGLTRAGLGALDRWLGVVFGLIRGYLLIVLAFMVTVIVMEGEKNLPNDLRTAQTTPMISQGARYFSYFAPDDYGEKLLLYLHDHAVTDTQIPETMNKVLGSSSELIKNSIDSANN